MTHQEHDELRSMDNRLRFYKLSKKIEGNYKRVLGYERQSERSNGSSSAHENHATATPALTSVLRSLLESSK